MSDDVFHYEGLACWGPIGSERLDELVALLPLESSHSVLDVGCGKAELMVRMAERYGVGGVGVDRSAAALAQARSALDERAPAVAVELVQGEASAFDPGTRRFDLISWLGGPYLGDDFAATVATLARWLKPAGYLLIGHGYWHEPPPDAYLAATDMKRDELTDSWTNVATVQGHGLRLLYACSSSRDGDAATRARSSGGAARAARAAREPRRTARRACDSEKRRAACAARELSRAARARAGGVCARTCAAREGD